MVPHRTLSSFLLVITGHLWMTRGYSLAVFGKMYVTPDNLLVKILFAVSNHDLDFIPIYVMPKSTRTIRSGAAISSQWYKVKISGTLADHQVEVFKRSSTDITYPSGYSWQAAATTTCLRMHLSRPPQLWPRR